MELMRRFFDADGIRCVMFYYQSIVKDNLQIPAGEKYSVVIYIICCLSDR